MRRLYDWWWNLVGYRWQRVKNRAGWCLHCDRPWHRHKQTCYFYGAKP